MKFTAFERTKQGTGASRRLRITGRVPGIVYGGASEPLMIELDHNALWQALKNEAFHASVLTMEINGAEQPVLLRDVQMHPFRAQVLHVDFQRVDENTRLHMKVPLHFSGEDQSPAVKSEGCIANHVINEIEVLCLPKDLPEFITVDLSGLRKGSSLHLRDIAMPKGVVAVARGRDKNPVVVSVVPVPGAEAEAAPAAAAAAPAKPAKGKGKK
ncbi:MAG: 50S ribosomal protein L25/general stress protein Ctc [Rhodoferax sp.]